MPDLRGISASLLVAACGRLLLLAVSFSGETSLHGVMASMPDVCSTHTGALLLALCAVAVLLCLASGVRSFKNHRTIAGALVVCALCLHAFTGHAASNGNFSLAELLQVVHLLGMATWSGSVIVSGLSVVPHLYDGRLGQTEESAPEGRSVVARYLGRLSVTSTWAVGAVLLSGLIKGYIATNASLHVLRTTPWGQVLSVKTALVTCTVLLGARNRWLLRAAGQRTPSFIRSVALTLRVEAISMLAVLLLSALLANSQPPLE